MTSAQELTHVACIGAGATAVMDAWLLLLKRLGVPVSSFALIGRWVGHCARGRFAHVSIGKAEPVAHELSLGWLTHYAVGIAYAGLLVAVQGLDWARQPTLLPALSTGLVTVLVPLFVMQPAMGSGFAGSKTPNPLKNCMRSLANHAVFGSGLYLAAAALARVVR
ncbi:MAG TPA: DUF2938 domain-containing protein [Burkholderiaceae bacterium]|nr:DUF2938 domain-containing protein [Burkholderiaceae bacterium]